VQVACAARFASTRADRRGARPCLENAGAYAPAGTPITVSVGHEAELTLAVRDRGAGIAPGNQDNLFGQFYRGVGAAAGRSEREWARITRGLTVAQGGRVTPRPSQGGAVFT